MWRNRTQFIERLKKRGFRELGSGMFATVLAKPKSSKVIKVAYASDGWPAYIMWAKQYGFLGTLAPNVTSFKLIKAVGPGEYGGKPRAFYAAVMERLDHTLSQESRLTEKTRLYETAGRIEDVIKARRDPNDAPLSDDQLKFATGLHAYQENTPALRSDFHGGNWMVRGKDLVLTDPFTLRFDTERTEGPKLTEQTSKEFLKAKLLKRAQTLHI